MWEKQKKLALSKDGHGGGYISDMLLINQVSFHLKCGAEMSTLDFHYSFADVKSSKVMLKVFDVGLDGIAMILLEDLNLGSWTLSWWLFQLPSNHSFVCVICAHDDYLLML